MPEVDAQELFWRKIECMLKRLREARFIDFEWSAEDWQWVATPAKELGQQ